MANRTVSDVNKLFSEMLALPPDTESATLQLRGGQLPKLTVVQVTYRPGQATPEKLRQRFTLVPLDGEPNHG